jgi:serine acetyltransferase
MEDGALTQDFDSHLLITPLRIPERPFAANRWARLQRWAIVAFKECWLAVLLFRAKVALRRRGVSMLPGLCDVVARALFGVHIGDRVTAGPGLMITHGHVVIDGETTIGANCQINPWVSVGLSDSRKLGFSTRGPTIGDYVRIGTGARILGPVRVGDYARIGANAVVVEDVPPYTTVVGIPARPLPIPAGAHGRSASEDLRALIFDYRLRRRSLRSVVDALDAALADGLAPLAATEPALAVDGAYLRGRGDCDDRTPEVIAALERIEAALAGGAG